MARHALLVGNSVSYSDTTKSVTTHVLSRTLGKLANLLTDLEQPFSFRVVTKIDADAKEVRSALEDGAERAATDGELFLFYYFGHGILSSGLQLQLLHPGRNKGETSVLSLETIDTRIRESSLKKSLFVLDCCYAGAVDRNFDSSLSGQHCRLASTTPSALAYVTSGRLEEPIGIFTAAVIESFANPRACVSATNNNVTAESLFAFAQQRTAELSGDQTQVPTIHGHLNETLFVYRDSPRIHLGYSEWADEKTAYAKILAICRTLSARNFYSIESLHKTLTRDYRKSFQTLFKTPDGAFEYRSVSTGVIARYMRFLQRLGFADAETLALKPNGRLLARQWRGRYNELLLDAIDTYLLREAALSREDILHAARSVLNNRSIPSRDEVADTLALRGRLLRRNDIGLVLDLLAYIGAIRVAEKRAYFPW